MMRSSFSRLLCSRSFRVDTGKKDYLERNPVGEWYFAHYSDATGFKPLYEVAVKEHIEQWQQDLKQKEAA